MCVCAWLKPFSLEPAARPLGCGRVGLRWLTACRCLRLLCGGDGGSEGEPQLAGCKLETAASLVAVAAAAMRLSGRSSTG